MQTEDIIQECIRTFINHKMGGLVIREKYEAAIRTVTTSDGDSIIFTIDDDEMLAIYYNNKRDHKTQIASVDRNYYDIPHAIECIVSEICEDYEDIEGMWLDLKDNYEPFDPSDWWKYGASPGF